MKCPKCKKITGLGSKNPATKEDAKIIIKQDGMYLVLSCRNCSHSFESKI